jgi:hypothetical protein
MYQGSGSKVLSWNSPKNLDLLAVWSIPFVRRWWAPEHHALFLINRGRSAYDNEVMPFHLRLGFERLLDHPSGNTGFY